MLAPAGPVYQAGTLSGNPLATAAGNAQLKYLMEEQPHDRLAARTVQLAQGVEAALHAQGVAATAASVGTMWGLFLTDERVESFEQAKETDVEGFGMLHRAMLEQGVFLAPSAFEAGFLSTAHTEADLEATVRAASEAASVLSSRGAAFSGR